jgi:hypothetical protein
MKTKLGNHTANCGFRTPVAPKETKYLEKKRKNKITKIPTPREIPSPPRVFLPATATPIKININVLNGEAYRR